MELSKVFKYSLQLAVMCCFSIQAYADGEGGGSTPTVNETIHIGLNAQNSLTPETTELLGERVDLNTGALSFSNTDISLPGNNHISMSIGRTHHGSSFSYYNRSDFGDWGLDIPHIRTNAIIADRMAGHWGRGKECSGEPDNEPLYGVMATEYYNGEHLHVPGKVSEQLVYRGVKKNKSNWKVTCITKDNGEIFSIQSTSGDTYIFSHKVIKSDRTIGSGTTGVNVVNIYMYVTKITDKFGNTVNYNYNSSGLTSITSSDGRRITISRQYEYPFNKLITSIEVNNRIWRYNYTSSGIKALSSVTRPDNKQWQYDLVNFSNVNYLPFECHTPNNRQNTQGSITHPSGLKGTFITHAVVRGKTNVPEIYNSILNIDYTKKCYQSMALKTKTLNGPGLPQQSWSYQYSEQYGFYTGETSAGSLYRISGTMPQSPSNVPNSAKLNNLDYKRTTVISPDGSKTNYYHNRNHQSVLDGALVATEYFDTNKTSLLKRVINSYIQGDIVGFPPYSHINSKPVKYRRRLIQQSIESWSGNNKITYHTQYSDFNAYGVARKTYEYNSFNNNKRYTKQSYQHDLTNWVLNLPRKTYISDYELTDSALTSSTPIREIEYAHFNDSNQLLPAKQYSYGQLVNTYKSYHIDGNLEKIELNVPLTAGEGNRTIEYSDYHRGIAQTITTALPSGAGSMTQSRTIDNNGWIESITDFNGNTTGYQYDAIGRIASIKAPAPKTGEPNWADTLFTWSYDGGDNSDLPVRTVKRCTLNATKTACEDTVKISTTTTFDGLLRPIEVLTSDGTTDVYQRSTYNAYNKLTFQSFPSSTASETLGTRYEYDGLQRQTKQSISHGGHITTEYLADNKIKTTDAEDNITTTTYLAYGSPSYQQATKIESPESVTTDIAIDIFGNTTSITQSGKNGTANISQTETRLYNAAKQLCMIKRNDVGNTYLQRKANGEVSWQAQGVSGTTCAAHGATDAQKVHFTYDNLGNQRTISYGDGTPRRTFTHDNNGNITNITGQGFSQSYNYNSLNLLDDETLNITGRSANLTLDYGYNSLGNLASLKYPDGLEAIHFAPNAFGQATQAIRTYADGTAPDVFVKGGNNKASYYPSGSINTFTYGNGVVHKTTLNDRLMPSQITDKLGNSNRVNLSYEYDNNNNITKLTNARNGIYSLSSLTYDGLDRLKTTAGGLGIGSSAITYDGLGNIRTYRNNSGYNAHNLSYGYTNNRLSSVSGTGTGSTGYNFNRSDSYDKRGNITHNGKREFDYNLANQMTKSGNSRFVYDGYNRRVKSVKDNGKTEYSMYSQAGKLLYRETGQGGINYISLGSKLVAKEGTGVVSSGDSIMNYKPFGESIETPKDDVGYTGHKFDKDLGLSYMQARYYDPVIGRFYSNDPIGYTAKNPVMSFNRYMYVNNNPYKYTDPNGEWLQLIGAAIGAGLEFGLQVHQKGFDNVDYSQVAVAGLAGAAGAGLGKLAVQVGKAYVSGAAATGALVDGAAATVIAGTVAAEGGTVIGASAAALNGGIDYLQGDRDTLPSVNEIYEGAAKGFVSSGIAGGVGSGGNLLKLADEVTEVVGQSAGKAAELEIERE